MNDKIFLHKYRVSAAQIGTAGESDKKEIAYDGIAIGSGTRVTVEVIPVASLAPTVREKLEADAIAAKKLGHVNIPTLRDFGVEDGQLVYVSEHFDGTLADEWVAKYGPMPIGPVLHIASQVVSAMGTAVVQRVVHYAINPGNLLLLPGQTDDGEWPLVKVLHFVGGPAKFAENGASRSSGGKPSPYSSPEQLEKKPIDFRSEIYSLGATMWFLLTGSPPPIASNVQAVRRIRADESAKLPANIRSLIARMLAPDPEERPGAPSVFNRLLEECRRRTERHEAIITPHPHPAEAPIPPVDSPQVPEKTEKKEGRIPVKMLGFAALFLAIGLIGGFALSGVFRREATATASKPAPQPVVTAQFSTPAPAPPVVPIPKPEAAPPASNLTRQVTDASTKEGNLVEQASGNEVIDPRVLFAILLGRDTARPYTLLTTSSAPFAETDSSRVVSEGSQVEIPTAPKRWLPPKVSDTPEKKVSMRESRPTEGSGREVRRAEPPPPAEPPIDVVTSPPPRLKRIPPEAKPSPTPKPKVVERTVRPQVQRPHLQIHVPPVPPE